jgi:hypothetical protein
VIDDFVLLKEEQPAVNRPDRKAHLGRFGND